MLVGLSFKVFDFFYERGRIQLNSGHMKIDNLLSQLSDTTFSITTGSHPL